MKTTLLKELAQRTSLPTPRFFKKIRAWAICVGLTITSATATFWILWPGNLWLIVATVVGGTATAIGTFMTYLPVEWNEIKTNNECNEDK